MKKIVSHTYKIFGIPIITFYDKNLQNLPLIFINHGFSSKKEIYTDMGWNFASYGFYSVILDAEYHGERKKCEFDLLKLEDHFDIVYHTTQDIKTLIKYFSKEKKVDINRVGITGNSMGGITSCYAGSVIDNISVIASSVGTPSWIEFLEYLSIKNPQYKNILISHKKFLLENDPYKNISRFKEKKIFLLNGEKDDVVPSIFSSKFYDKITSKNIISQNDIKFKIFPTGHTLSSAMKEEIYSWFKNKL